MLFGRRQRFPVVRIVHRDLCMLPKRLNTGTMMEESGTFDNRNSYNNDGKSRGKGLLHKANG